MSTSELTGLIAAIGTVTAPILAFLGYYLDRRDQRRAVLYACAACTEKLKALAPKKPTALIVIAVIAYAVAFASIPAVRQGVAMLRLRVGDRALRSAQDAAAEAKACGDECTKKTGCRCVGENCNCGALDVAPPAPAPTPPRPAPAPNQKRPRPPTPSSSLARMLPKMAGELNPPWYANMPPSSAPLAPSL